MPVNALDIGTGTGLLSLMMAQQLPFYIDAIEMDEAAYLQATSNVQMSPWNAQIKVYWQRLQDFYPDKKYEFIFSNPPFFDNDLRSNDDQKNMAKHEQTLTTQALFENVNRLLDTDGRFAVLIPFHRRENYINTAQYFNLFIEEELQVKHSEKHPFFRTVLLMRKIQTAVPKCEALSIKDNHQQYTESFMHLLKPYYLKL